MKLNERIKDCRIRVGLTQEQVAEAMNVSRQAVTKWENGQSAPSTENLFKLAELFGTTVDMILADEKRKPEEKDYFAFLQNRNFWISSAAGFVLFLTINPYGHNMYIPALFTLLCIGLNAYSVLTFSVLLYNLLCRKPVGEDFGMYLGLLSLGSVGHAVFSVMSWGSWVCLVLSVIFLILLLVRKRSESRKNIEKST